MEYGTTKSETNTRVSSEMIGKMERVSILGKMEMHTRVTF